MKNLNLLRLFSVSFLVYLFAGCNLIQPAKIPVIKSGFLDLSEWDFKNYGETNLDGEWEFYWNQLILPEEIKNIQPTGYIKIPDKWNKFEINGQKINGDGYATFHILVKVPLSQSLMALYIPDINTAYRLYINGELMAQNGIVGTSEETSLPQYLPQVVPFYVEEEIIDITILVSNFQHNQGGIWKSINLGNHKQIQLSKETRKAFELFLIGALTVMTFYHISLFLMGKKEKALLYFGSFCFLILLRSLFTGERIFIELFPAFDWTLAYRIEILPIYIGPPLFLMFIKSMYPDETNQLILNIFFIIGIIGTACILVISSHWFDTFFIIYRVIIIFAALFCLYVLIRAILKKRDGALFIIFGFLIFFGTYVIVMTLNELRIGYIDITPLGILFFIFSEFAINFNFVKAEVALKKSEAKNKAILNTIPDSMFQINKEGLIVDSKFSKSFDEFLTDKKIIGKSISDIFSKDFAKAVISSIKKVLKTKKATIFEQELDNDKRKFYFEIRMVASGADRVLTIVRDITKEKEIQLQSEMQQEQLLQADKLVALGTLVAGVAHEINNPNNSILLTTEVLEDSWKSIIPVLDIYLKENGDFPIGGYLYSELRQEIPESFIRVIKNSKRIKNIITDLKNFARNDIVGNKEEVDINLLVESSIRLVENLIKQSTDNFHTHYDSNIPIIEAKTQQLEQVFINLIQNACQALPDNRKKLSVSTKYDKESNRIIVSVEDEGTGMDKETLKRIFDPFFTTKRGIGGTGLGLSVSSKIIKEHGGNLLFNSKPGKGTEAKVILPVNQRRKKNGKLSA